MSTSSIDASPEALLQAAHRGDSSALNELLSTYRRYVAFLARTQVGRRLQGKADPSDLVQETLFEAHRHFDRFRGATEVEFAAWLRQILAGLIANHVRRYLGTKQRDARLERELSLELNDTSCALRQRLSSAARSPSEEVVRREAAVTLATALELLPDHYRQVIILRHLEDRSFAEVAAEMGRTVDSVEKLWVRALARLRKSLGESE